VIDLEKKKIILIGYDFDPEKATGDKTFWKENIKFISQELKEILIFIINIGNKRKKLDFFKLGDCLINIEYIQPAIINRFSLSFGESSELWGNAAIPSLLRLIEKTADGIRIFYKLRKLNLDYSYRHIHLMDNFGPANRIIVNSTRASVSVSAVTYRGLNKLIYDIFIKISYDINKLKIICRSVAFAKKLQSIGIAHDRILHIPWGIKIDKIASRENRLKMKQKLSFPNNMPLYLWSGYIQPHGPKDFLAAYQTAKIALEKGLNAIFYFAFNLESINNKIIKLNDPTNRIYVQATNNNEFLDLMKAADIFYSLIENKNAILAPPLTWIEALGHGLPILTSMAGGVEEIIDAGKTGFIAKNREEAIKYLFIIRDCFDKMGEYCFNKADEKFNLEKISKKYLSLFTEEK